MLVGVSQWCPGPPAVRGDCNEIWNSEWEISVVSSTTWLSRSDLQSSDPPPPPPHWHSLTCSAAQHSVKDKIDKVGPRYSPPTNYVGCKWVSQEFSGVLRNSQESVLTLLSACDLVISMSERTKIMFDVELPPSPPPSPPPSRCQHPADHQETTWPSSGDLQPFYCRPQWAHWPPCPAVWRSPLSADCSQPGGVGRLSARHI